MKTPLRFLPLPAALVLGACTVGPNYSGPPALLPTPDAQFARQGEGTVADQPTLAHWWEALGDPVLDELQQRALTGSPDVAMARARLDDAKAALGIERAGGKPSLSAIAVAGALRVPGISGSSSSDPNSGSGSGSGQSGTSTTELYNLGVNASWEIDLFGGSRRRDEAAGAEVRAAEASVADAQVSLTSAIAQAYVEFRDRQQRTALAQDALDGHAKRLELQQQRFDRGAGSRIEVERERAALSDAQRQLSGLQADRDSYANALAVLTGAVPGTVDPLLAQVRDIPLPPASVAVGNPENLLKRRPDIRVADGKLAAETARIGVAQAARFPRLTFLGIFGIGGSKPSDLTNLDDFTAIAAPMLQWNFLDFGKGKAQVRQAEAKRDVAESSYRATVLTALREVEDGLTKFRAAREAVASAARAEASTAQIERLTTQRYDLGAAAKPELLSIRLEHNTALAQLEAAKAQLTVAFVTLQKALGLGWSETPAS